MRHRSRTGAYVLILVGVVFLLVNLGVLPVAQLRQLLSQWWPLILIAVGVWLLAKPRKSDS
jgi:ribose/xylose/arabinose/galactoside ABC-type transport system permease subunit